MKKKGNEKTKIHSTVKEGGQGLYLKIPKIKLGNINIYSIWPRFKNCLKYISSHMQRDTYTKS